jgi:hypothetical protein
MKLWYETLRGNWNNENSHMVYIDLIATKDNVPILDADVVDINTTFFFLLFGKISLNSDIDFLNKPTYLLTIS